MKRYSGKLRNFIIFVMIIGILAGGYYTLFYTNVFTITNVNLYDNRLISSHEILNSAGLDRDVNYFKLNQYEVKDNLLDHPQIKNVSVKKIFPNSIDIRIVERVAEVAVLYSETYLLVDDDMVVVEVSNTPKELYVINGYNFENFYVGYVINDDNSEVLSNAMNLSRLIESSDIVIRPVLNIVEDEIELVFNEEYKALFGDGNKIEDKFNFMLGIYKEQKRKDDCRGLINVSFDGQATFTLFGE